MHARAKNIMPCVFQRETKAECMRKRRGTEKAFFLHPPFKNKKKERWCLEINPQRIPCLLDVGVYFQQHYSLSHSALFSKIWLFQNPKRKRKQSISCKCWDFIWTMSNLLCALNCIMLLLWSCILPQGWFMLYGGFQIHFCPYNICSVFSLSKNSLFYVLYHLFWKGNILFSWHIFSPYSSLLSFLVLLLNSFEHADFHPLSFLCCLHIAQLCKTYSINPNGEWRSVKFVML